MRINLFSFTRDVHQYVGLFLSPFVLMFAVSVILLNHPGIPIGNPVESPARTLTIEGVPDLDKFEGRERVEQARRILQQAGISGEIGFINHSDREGRFKIPAARPGYEAVVELSKRTGEVSIKERRTGFLDSFIYLHKMPGPHLANIRGNSVLVRAWSWLADGTAWLLVFLSVSGFYLWFALKVDRPVGWIMITAGSASLLGALYAICS